MWVIYVKLRVNQKILKRYYGEDIHQRWVIVKTILAGEEETSAKLKHEGFSLRSTGVIVGMKCLTIT